jgi:hypothetical protein
MLAARGVSVTCKTIRRCGLKFGRAFANRIRHLARDYRRDNSGLIAPLHDRHRTDVPLNIHRRQSDGAGHAAAHLRAADAKRRSEVAERTGAGNADGYAWIEHGLGYSIIVVEADDTLLEQTRQVRQELAAAG